MGELMLSAKNICKEKKYMQFMFCKIYLDDQCILLPKLVWPTVRKDREIFLRSLEQYIQTVKD